MCEPTPIRTRAHVILSAISNTHTRTKPPHQSNTVEPQPGEIFSRPSRVNQHTHTHDYSVPDCYINSRPSAICSVQLTVAHTHTHTLMRLRALLMCVTSWKSSHTGQSSTHASNICQSSPSSVEIFGQTCVGVFVLPQAVVSCPVAVVISRKWVC